MKYAASPIIVSKQVRLTLAVLWAGFGLCFGLLFCGTPLEAADYRLGFGDKIRLRVHEWRVDRGDFFEWSPLTGDFAIGPTGTLSLPVIGEIPANGATARDLGDRIAGALQEHAGLARRPIAAVEIAEFRPFYIVGGVEKPGPYPFRPGMTVIEALSMAQGLYRARDAGLMRIERDSIMARGDLRVVALQLSSLSLRRARLQAELDQRETIQFPTDTVAGIESGSAGWTSMMREETLIFQQRRESLQRQLETGSHLIASLEQEIQSLRERIVLRKRQADAVNRELGKIRDLVDRGLSNTSRQLELERLVSEYQSSEVELGTAVLRAQQEIAKAKLAMTQLQDQRRAEIVQDLQHTQTQIDENKEKQQTAQGLVSESEFSAVRLDMATRRQPVEPAFSIVRRTTEGESREMPVTQTTAIEPGDIIKVELPVAGQPMLGPAPLTAGEKTVDRSSR